jgi:hypothetical protein
MSFARHFKCNASFMASVKATYSASAVESDTRFCFLDSQLITLPAYVKKSPEYDFLSMVHAPQSASARPTIGTTLIADCAVLVHVSLFELWNIFLGNALTTSRILPK